MNNELIGGLSMGVVIGLLVVAIIYQKFKPLFHQDRFFVTIITPGKKLERHFIAPKSGDNGVTGFFFKKDRTGYIVDTDCVVNGQFNTPTLMYKKGYAAPLTLNSELLNFSASVGDKDFYEATQNTVASDLMRSIVKPTSMMLFALIIVGAVVGGAIYVNMQTSKKLQGIEKQIQTLSAQGSPFDARTTR